MDFNDEIATLFDNANVLHSYIVENKKIIFEEKKNLEGIPVFEKVNLIISQNPSVLICGGINKRDFLYLANNGINLIKNVSGSSSDIISEFIKNFIENNAVLDKNNNRRRFRGGRR